MAEQPAGIPERGDGFSTDDLIAHLHHAKDRDEVKIVLGQLSRNIPKLLSQKRIDNEFFIYAEVPAEDIPEHEFDKAERVFRERFGFGQNGLLTRAFGSDDLFAKSFGHSNLPVWKEKDPKKDSEFEIVWNAITHFGKHELSDKDIEKMYHNIEKALGQKPQIEDKDFVSLFKNGGLSPIDAQPELDYLADTQPIRVGPQPVPPPENSESSPVVKQTEDKPAYILAYEQELVRLKRRHDEERAEAADVGGWDIPGRTADEIKELEALGPKGYAEQKGIPISDNAPVATPQTETSEPGPTTDMEPSAKKHQKYSASNNSERTRDLSAELHKKKGRTLKRKHLEETVTERGYDSLEITRSTLDDLLDAEANYMEFNKPSIHAEDPRRHSVFGPSVAERRRKYAKWLDMAAENHRKSLQLAFAEIDSGDIARGVNREDKKDRDKLLKENFDRMDARGKVMVLKQLEGVLQEKVKKFGLKTTKEIEIEKEQKRQKKIETEKLKIEKNRNKKSQQTRKEQVANLAPESVVKTTAQSPVNHDTGDIRFESKVEVPQEIIEASRANISGKVATEVDRFLITPDKYRRVVRYIKEGKENYHFVRLQRPNKQGKGELQLRYFYLLDGDQIDIDRDYKGHPLKEEDISDIFLIVIRDFQQDLDEGKIEEFEIVDLDGEFIKRLAELNQKLVEQNRLRQESQITPSNSGKK